MPLQRTFDTCSELYIHDHNQDNKQFHKSSPRVLRPLVVNRSPTLSPWPPRICFCPCSLCVQAFLGGSVVKSPPVMQQMQVRSLAQEDPLEKGMATHPSWRRKWQPTPVHLPRRFHGWRSLAGHSPWGSQRAGHD